MFKLITVFTAGSISSHDFMDVHNAKRVAGSIFHSPVVTSVTVKDEQDNVALSLIKDPAGKCAVRANPETAQ